MAGYCCSVEEKEYWIHDINKPTLYPPTYLAFEQHQYDADPDHYNSREAILEEYRYLGFPGNKTPKNIQRCRTDWLSTIMPIISDYYRGSVNYPRNYLDWFKREHPQIYQEIYHGNSPGARAHARAQFHELVRERRNQMSFNELAYNGVGVQFPSATKLYGQERAYHKISLKICKDCLQRWKKSPRAECNCIMCTDVKNLDENTDHVLSLQIDTDPHSYVNNPAGNEVRGPGERGAGKRRKTLRPLNGGNPCVLHCCTSSTLLYATASRHPQWKMQWEREADDTPQNP